MKFNVSLSVNQSNLIEQMYINENLSISENDNFCQGKSNQSLKSYLYEK